MKFNGLEMRWLTEEQENSMKLELIELKRKVKNREIIGKQLADADHKIHLYTKYFFRKYKIFI